MWTMIPIMIPYAENENVITINKSKKALTKFSMQGHKYFSKCRIKSFFYSSTDRDGQSKSPSNQNFTLA